MTTTLMTTTSADGTTIAYERLGSGPALIVLPGAMSTAETWRDVGRRLADDVTVLLVNRRFYAPSGAGPSPSSFAREVADVRAMIDVAGGSAHVLGHSYGGLLALHAACTEPSGMRSLLLYEAPVATLEAETLPALDDYRALLAGGDPFGAISLFLESVVQLPQEEMAALTDPDDEPPTPAEIAALAEALLHDIESISGDDVPVGAFAAIDLPVLMTAGELTWSNVAESTEALHAVLPHAELVTWPGQSHFANTLAPEMVAATVREFLGRVNPS